MSDEHRRSGAGSAATGGVAASWLAEVEAPSVNSQPAKPVLELVDLWKSFGELEVLRGINLSVSRGEAVVIIGPSGCGKSTLLRCVNGLERVTSGSIVFDGVDLTQPRVDLVEVRRRVGLVFQQFALFPHLTVLANLTMPPRRILGVPKKQAEAEARELLSRVGIGEKEYHYPRELSGGQQQRVAIARALMMKPVLMLFDEVTSALDPELVGEVLDVMRDLAASGMTMLIVTHEMSFAREVGDDLVFIDGGEIVEAGAPKEVLAAPQHERTRQFLRRVIH